MIVLLFLFWLVLSQRITLEICLFGVVLTACVTVFMCRCLGYRLRTEARIWKNVGLGIAYLFVLLWEILCANLAVAGVVLSPRPHPAPAIVILHVPLKTPVLQAVFANSITITPGTITVDQAGDRYTVHCLDGSMAPDPEKSMLVRILKRMEGKK